MSSQHRDPSRWPWRLAAGALAPAFLAAAVRAAVDAWSAASVLAGRAYPGLSLAAATALGLVFLTASARAAAVSLWPARAPLPRRPRLARVILTTAAMLAVSLLVIRSEVPTSFVSWEQSRGVPLVWSSTGRYYGPCVNEPRVCQATWLDSVSAVPLLVDAAWMAAAGVFLTDWVSRRRGA